MRARAQRELEKAQELRNNEEAHIQRRAEYQANKQFQEFIEREFGKETRGREARLEEYCKEITFKDGQSVLDKFEAKEHLRKKELEHSWGYGR